MYIYYLENGNHFIPLLLNHWGACHHWLPEGRSDDSGITGSYAVWGYPITRGGTGAFLLTLALSGHWEPSAGGREVSPLT